METADGRGRARRRQRARLSVLRQRVVVVSALGFTAFYGLATQHALGSSKRRAAAARQQAVAAQATATFFDQHDDGFAFADGATPAATSGSTGTATPTPVAQPPAVAQTNVS